MPWARDLTCMRKGDDQPVTRFYQLLGERVRAAREDKDLTQAALAERLDLSRTSITNLENGTQRPPAHHLARMAQVLEMPITELIPEWQRVASVERIHTDWQDQPISRAADEFIRAVREEAPDER